MAEQPVASSAPETEVNVAPETPEVDVGAEPTEAAPAPEAGGDERSRVIPRERFDEVYNRMRQAEDLLTKFLTSEPAAQPQPQPEDDDPLYREVKSVSQIVNEMKAEREAEKDARAADTFWKENDEFSQLRAEVEAEYTNFRKNGYTVTRDQVLDYMWGQRGRKEVKTKVRAAPRSQSPAINQVAHAESAPTSRRVGKDLSTMSESELLEHERQNPGALEAYLRGKTF